MHLLNVAYTTLALSNQKVSKSCGFIAVGVEKTEPLTIRCGLVPRKRVGNSALYCQNLDFGAVAEGQFVFEQSPKAKFFF